MKDYKEQEARYQKLMDEYHHNLEKAKKNPAYSFD
jgi:hypothetical protein